MCQYYFVFYLEVKKIAGCAIHNSPTKPVGWSCGYEILLGDKISNNQPTTNHQPTNPPTTNQQRQQQQQQQRTHQPTNLTKKPTNQQTSTNHQWFAKAWYAWYVLCYQFTWDGHCLNVAWPRVGWWRGAVGDFLVLKMGSTDSGAGDIDV